MEGGNEERLVWDLPLRVFHWSLVLCFVGSYVTAKLGFDYRQQHFWFGYTLMGLLIFRLMWGVVGTRHARFSTVFTALGRVRQYVRNLSAGNESSAAGHNPLGALSVIALLVLLILQVVSGLFMDDDILYAGPWMHTVSGDIQDIMETIHTTAVNALLALVVLHLVAVAYYSLIRRKKIIGAMITGKARVSADQAIANSRLLLAVILGSLTAALVYWLVVVAPPPAPDSFF